MNSTELLAMADWLKQAAAIHAQEARTANATIAEIYQLCSDARGESGNWHGAEPVRAKLAELRAEVERVNENLDGAHETITGLQRMVRERSERAEKAERELAAYKQAVGEFTARELIKQRVAELLALPTPPSPACQEKKHNA